jgi:hypothetical protein
MRYIRALVSFLPHHAWRVIPILSGWVTRLTGTAGGRGEGGAESRAGGPHKKPQS